MANGVILMSTKVIATITSLATNLVVLSVLALAVNILPSSPFQAIIKSSAKSGYFYQYLKYVAYFIPIERIVVTMELWLMCVSNYWFYQFVSKCYNGASSLAGLGSMTKKP